MKKPIVLLASFGLITSLVFLTQGFAAKNDLSSADFIPVNGNPKAPEFSLYNAKGDPVQLHSYRGKILLLYFWTTW